MGWKELTCTILTGGQLFQCAPEKDGHATDPRALVQHALATSSELPKDWRRVGRKGGELGERGEAERAMKRTERCEKRDACEVEGQSYTYRDPSSYRL